MKLIEKMMRTIQAFLRRTILVAVIAFTAVAPIVQAQGEATPPPPLPRDVIDAWEKAGLRAVWVDFEKSIWSRSRPVSEPARPGDLAEFEFRDSYDRRTGRRNRLPVGVFASLPAPEQPFGLIRFHRPGLWAQIWKGER